MHNTQYPADPDCQKCKGTGAIISIKEPKPFDIGCFSYSKCGCSGPENIKKIQDRCSHECYCRKCGKSFEQSC